MKPRYSNKKRSRKASRKLSRKQNRKYKRKTYRKKGGNNGKSVEFPLRFGHVYLETCPACQNMKIEWNKLLTMVPKDRLVDISDDYDGKIGSFNKTYKTNLKYDFFPTIFKLKSVGSNVEYYDSTLPRTADKMKEWLMK